MDAQKIIRNINDFLEEVEKERLIVASYSANVEEILQKLQRGSVTTKKDNSFELELNRVRTKIRNVRREMDNLLSNMSAIRLSDCPGGQASLAVRVVASGRNLFTETSNLTTVVGQVYSRLNGSTYGVLGWNLKHDAQEGEAGAEEIARATERISAALSKQ